MSLSLYYYVFPHISTDIDSPINQNVHMCTCNHLEWLLTLSIRSRSFKIQFWNVLLWQWLHEYCRKKVFLKSYVSKDCTDDKPFTKHIMNYSYKILFTIKSGRLCYQNYLKYIISNYGKGFGMCCYFNSGRKKLILKIEIPLKYCNKNVSSKNFSFRMKTTQYHTSFSEKSYLRYCYRWTYYRTIWLKKGQQKVFGQFLPKVFNKNPKNK